MENARLKDPIVWFEAVSLADEPRVGGKGANLGELTAAGFHVPPGFVITADAFLGAMEAGGVRSTLADGVATVDPSVPETLDAASAGLRELVKIAGIPEPLREEIAHAYDRLSAGAGSEPMRVAVRSSAAGEDSADASFAGMNGTFTNVCGIDAVLRAVRKQIAGQ
jgi:pyruvate,water dikinase